MSKTITHIDCFSGPGGICTGFKAAGIKTLVAIEKVDSCAETYSANHPEVKVINKDIRKVDRKDLKEFADTEVDILTSGMPCETFSTAGSKSRSSYDYRQQLYSEAIRVARIVKAKLILFENVPGILSKKVVKGGDRHIVDDIFDELSANGYKYYVQTTLNAMDFGVPQNRERYFILASRDKNIKPKIPVACHNGVVTVKDCFTGLPKIEANSERKLKKFTTSDNAYTKLLKDNSFWKLGNGAETNLSYHVAPRHRPGTIERFKLLDPGEGLKDLFTKHSTAEVERLQKAKILPKKWYIQRNKRLELNKPSKTITSHCLDELVHPKLNRALTVREVARLQSFPDSYDFKGGPFICPHLYETQDKYEQIGDAVPPLLAFRWGEVIREILEE